MNLPMSWDEWAHHDGVALATRVAKGERTAAELSAQGRDQEGHVQDVNLLRHDLL